MKQTLKEQIIKIISNNLEIEHDLTGFWTGKTADQILSVLKEEKKKWNIELLEMLKYKDLTKIELVDKLVRNYFKKLKE
jgi:hypothetical protein